MVKLGFIATNDLAKLADDCRFAAENGYTGLGSTWWANAADLTHSTPSKRKRPF